MTLKCPGCGALNRIPSLPKTRIRCGACKREFAPRDLVHAQPEAPPPRREVSVDEFELESEDD